MATPETQRSKRTRLLLVDDHPVVTDGLIRLVERDRALEVIGVSRTAHEAMDVLGSEPFDLAIVDISLNGISGIDLIKHIKARHGEVRVLVLSMHREILYAERALRAGADGFITKREASERILTAIRTVLDGQLYVSEEIGSRMLDRFVRGADEAASPVSRLSDRELEVLYFIGEGRSTRDIAGQLNLSVKTIESHRANIKRKLDLSNASELVRFAVQWREAKR